MLWSFKSRHHLLKWMLEIQFILNPRSCTMLRTHSISPQYICCKSFIEKYPQSKTKNNNWINKTNVFCMHWIQRARVAQPFNSIDMLNGKAQRIVSLHYSNTFQNGFQAYFNWSCCCFAYFIALLMLFQGLCNGYCPTLCIYGSEDTIHPLEVT